MTCSVEGCGQEAHSRTYCRSHYMRWYRYGDPLGESGGEPYRPLVTESHWRASAKCRGMDVSIFYPERGSDAVRAKRVCEECPVIEDCRDYALRHEGFGVWAKTSEKERQRLRRVRKVPFQRLESMVLVHRVNA